MKIFICGFPRSRSSLFLETLSRFYQIPILGESLNDLVNALPHRMWFDDVTVPEPSCDDFDKIKSTLIDINTAPDGVIRMHPLQFSMSPFSGEVLNFDLYNFRNYDQIFFTDRESVADRVASHYIGKNITGRLTYKSKSQLSNNLPPIELFGWLDSQRALLLIKTVFYERLIEKELKKYLVANNIVWTQLYYNSIPEYISTHFPNVQSTHVKTNYNYKSLITDYDKISKVYNQIQPEMLEMFYRFNPQFLNVL